LGQKPPAVGRGLDAALHGLRHPVGVGELLSVYLFGMVLYFALRKRGTKWLS
jgi:hypothetical protein